MLLPRACSHTSCALTPPSQKLHAQLRHVLQRAHPHLRTDSLGSLMRRRSGTSSSTTYGTRPNPSSVHRAPTSSTPPSRTPCGAAERYRAVLRRGGVRRTQQPTAPKRKRNGTLVVGERHPPTASCRAGHWTSAWPGLYTRTHLGLCARSRTLHTPPAPVTARMPPPLAHAGLRREAKAALLSHECHPLPSARGQAAVPRHHLPLLSQPDQRPSSLPIPPSAGHIPPRPRPQPSLFSFSLSPLPPPAPRRGGPAWAPAA